MIARLPDGTWSAPSCIATGGVGFGLQIGADLSEFVVVLNSDEAISAFAKGGNLTIGGSLAAAAGPIGVGGAVNTAILNPAPMFTYSKSKGLYAGVSLEGTVLVERVSPSRYLSFGVLPLPFQERAADVFDGGALTHRKMPTRHSTVNVRSSPSLSLFNLADSAISFTAAIPAISLLGCVCIFLVQSSAMLPELALIRRRRDHPEERFHRLKL